jgi:alkanesulfonate monooxygenase SsuD/methylene tetrahydromethanopterin reductase-like flavin-dependent oxidoreductase (luciferase family)
MFDGLTLPNAGVCGDPRVLVELAVLAEETGWDGVFLEDYIIHHSVPDAPTCDPWAALAAIAVRTERLRIGTSVTPLPRRRPWKVAREAVTVDHLSHGRMILGVGLGDINDPGFGNVGEPTDTRMRAEMLDEGLAILAGLWSGEPFSFSGKHYHLEEMTFAPRPLQRPRIPIWVGGNWPHQGVMRRAARWDGFCGGKEHGPDEPWLPTSDEVRSLCADIARHRTSDAPLDIALGGASRGDDWDTERATRRALAEAGATWWIEYVPCADLATMREGVARGPLR